MTTGSYKACSSATAEPGSARPLMSRVANTAGRGVRAPLSFPLLLKLHCLLSSFILC